MLCVSAFANAQTDITADKLTNAGLSTVDAGWTYYSDDFKYTDWKTDGDVPVVEFYSQWNAGASVPMEKQKDFKFSQKVTLAAGEYRIAVNAFYRNGAGDGTNEDKAWIFAGDQKKNVAALNSDGVGAYTGSNDLYKAANAFSKGDFLNSFDFTVDAEGEVELGFQGFFNTSLSWCILGPVKLYYLGPKKDAWYYAIRVTDKWKEGGADKNKQADFNAEGGYVEIVTKSNANTFDNQVFFQIADAAPEGKLSKNDKVVLKFKAMAILDAESTLEQTEIQAGGGFHKSYDGAGWMPISNQAGSVTIKIGEWTEIEKEITVLDDQVTNFSLDLSYDSKPITYRFDDVSFEYVKGKDDWYNNNVVVAKDPAVEYEDGKSYEFPAAPYVYDAKGNGYAEVKTMANPTKEWASQIFFTIPENLAGKQVAISMKVKASKAVTAKAQRHQDNTGSTYMDNYPDANIDFTTEWNKVSVIVDTKKENGEAVDIAKCFVLNLAVDAEALTFDFDSLKFEQYFAPVDYGELIEIPLEGTVVMERDFTKETSYTHSPNWANNKDGYTDKLIVGEGLEIVNTADQGMWESQFFIMEGFNLVGGRDYAVRYTLKYEGDGGDMQINMGDWTNNDQGVETLAAGPIYTQMVRLFPSFKGDATGAHVFFQSGAIKGRMIVEKVEVIDVTPKYDEMDWSENILKNGDLSTDDMSAFILKNNDVENPEMLLAEKSAIGDGDSFEIGIETAARPTNEDGSVGGNDHDAQFFVRLPYVLPKGKKFNLEFDLYAEKPNTLAIQAHGEPGQYKGNLSSVTTDPKGSGIVHYQKYLSAPADMRSIAFNLAVADATTYGFSNIKVQVVNDDMAAIKAATDAADATSLWAETLALNEACYAGRTTETEGKNYTEESVKALEDAIAAGKAELKKNAAEVTAESLTAATKAIKDAINGLTKGEQLLPAPETDPDYANFVEIPLDQQDVENGDVHLAPKEDKGSYTQFTTTDGICVVFKMKDIDVTDCDYITIKFAKPAPAGQSYAVWTGNDNKGIDEGVSEIKYVFAEDPNCKIQNGILPEVSIISIFTGAGKDVSVYGVYKHKAAPALAYTDLTKEMFFVWSDWTDADATAQAGCAYEVGTSSDMPYGDGSVINYADLSEYATLEVTTTEGAPRFLFNRDVKDGQWNENEADSHLIDNTKGGWSAKYFTSKDNGDGSTTYIVDIAALVADKGYAHLHSIKGANWAKTTVTDMKLGYVGEKPALPIPVAINGIAEGASVKDGKYFINGQIVIVKNGVKYNAAGVAIK